jgi:hypothetical protein
VALCVFGIDVNRSRERSTNDTVIKRTICVVRSYCDYQDVQLIVWSRWNDAWTGGGGGRHAVWLTYVSRAWWTW